MVQAGIGMSEELEMIDNEKHLPNNLQCYSDEHVFHTTGIRDWSSRYSSYGKILNRHSIFLHDKQGIYFVDQLALTYTSDYNHLFFRNPKLFADNELVRRFTIDDNLV